MKDQGGAKERFEATFAALKAILKPYEPGLVVQTDEPDCYYLNTTKLQKKRPIMFAAVRLGKAYVSYHLMPVYCCAELLEGMSEPLRARMQGKASFNFKVIDPALVHELTQLTERCLQRFKAAGLA
jgi:hypothetical protein